MPNMTADQAKNSKYLHLLLLVFFLLAYILPLGARDLLVPDETRYGEIPREMLAGGGWIVPHFNGLRYFEKPVLGYWLHAAPISWFGENNFAVRFPSALAVGLSALLVLVLVVRVCRYGDQEQDPFPAILAPLIFLSCFEVVGVGNIALLDNIFCLFLTATITAFYCATESPSGSARQKTHLVLAGLACGLAFLVKGFVAFAVPVLALAPFLLWQRRAIDLLRMTWLPIGIAVLVALPWSIAIQLKEPDFWHFFFWNEHIRRFLSHDAQHKASFWLFFLAAPVLFLPWSFVTPTVVSGLRRLLDESGMTRRLIRLCLCWLLLPFLFFSASHGKLLTYILPCFPPFAILAAFGLNRMLGRGKSRSFQAGTIVTALVFILLLSALIISQLTGIGGRRLFSQPGKAILVAGGLLFLILFLFRSLSVREHNRKLLLFAVAPLPLFFLLHFTIPDIVIQQSDPGRLLMKHRSQLQSDSIIISGVDAVGAACWFLKTDHVYLLRNAGELSYGLQYKEGAHRLLDVAGARRLIELNRGKTAIIARAKTLRGVERELPAPVQRDDGGSNGYVLLLY